MGRRFWEAIIVVAGLVVMAGIAYQDYQIRMQNSQQDGVPRFVDYAPAGHTITIVQLDHGSSRYEIHRNRSNYSTVVEEQVMYDGGFIGYVTFGVLRGAGRYGVYNGRAYVISCWLDKPGEEAECHSGYGVDSLPPRYQEILENGRRALGNK